MEEKMTLFYLKRTGAIKCFCSGEQTMAFYGDEREDYEPIIGCITIPFNEFIMNNRQSFKVENGQVVLSGELAGLESILSNQK